VLGCDCGGSIQNLIEGLSYIQNHGPRPGILSLSLGSSKSNTLNSALSAMTNTGDFVAFVAAGNDNVDACTTSPASASNVVVVGATAPNDYRSSYSNYGSCLDIFAPGDNIYAAVMGSQNQISPESGTSFSQPHVAGLCVRHLLRNPADLDQIASCWTAVQNAATSNTVNNAGPNSPNLMAFSGSASPNSPPPPPTTSGNPPQPPPNSPNQPQLPPGQNAGTAREVSLWFMPLPWLIAAIAYPIISCAV
jgi:subtilisin family serine protease